MMRKQAVIVGGGPADLAAALRLKQKGVTDILILEREHLPGGILRQCIHDGFGLSRFGESLSGPEYAQRFIDRVQAEVGSGTQAVASSHQLVRTLALTPPVERETALAALLAREQVRHRLDFLRMLPPRLPRRWWR